MDTLRLYEVTDPIIQLLLLKERLLRALSESFRWVMTHVQAFTKDLYIPAYSTSGSQSLLLSGFASENTYGIPRRPILPKDLATYGCSLCKQH